MNQNLEAKWDLGEVLHFIDEKREAGRKEVTCTLVDQLETVAGESL